MKNNVDVLYFECSIPMHILFVEDGEMDKRVFLATWKDIPSQNEEQSEIKDVQHNAGSRTVCVCVCIMYWVCVCVCRSVEGGKPMSLSVIVLWCEKQRTVFL